MCWGKTPANQVGTETQSTKVPLAGFELRSKCWKARKDTTLPTWPPKAEGVDDGMHVIHLVILKSASQPSRSVLQINGEIGKSCLTIKPFKILPVSIAPSKHWPIWAVSHNSTRRTVISVKQNKITNSFTIKIKKRYSQAYNGIENCSEHFHKVLSFLKNTT